MKFQVSWRGKHDTSFCEVNDRLNLLGDNTNRKEIKKLSSY